MTSEERKQVEYEVRRECSKIAAAEAAYWAECTNDGAQDIAIGGMGASANICCSILMGKSAKRVELELAARSHA